MQQQQQPPYAPHGGYYAPPTGESPTMPAPPGGAVPRMPPAPYATPNYPPAPAYGQPAAAVAHAPPGSQFGSHQSPPMPMAPSNGGSGPRSGYSLSPPPPVGSAYSGGAPMGAPAPPQYAYPAASAAPPTLQHHQPPSGGLTTGYERPTAAYPSQAGAPAYSSQASAPHPPVAAGYAPPPPLPLTPSPPQFHHQQQQHQPPPQQFSHQQFPHQQLSHQPPLQQQQQYSPAVPPGPSLMRPMMATSQAPASPRLSAAQMPNVVAVQETDQARYDGTDGATFRSSVTCDILPPLPTTDVAILDDGNCSSRFMRPTLYNVPLSEDLQQSARIPLAIIIQPFAKAHPREAPIPVVDFGEGGPIRCNRCRAYINLFDKFLRGGRQYECNICSMVNDVPDDYFYNLDASGRRADIQNRPELRYGTVDFVASKEYSVRKPVPPYLLFAVDVSRQAIQNGAFASALAAIRTMVEAHLSGQHRLYAKMAIITFDKAISVYDLRAAEPQILVMSDVHEPFVPLHDGLFFDPMTASEQLFALLERLPAMFLETRIVDSCAGAAAAFALEAMRSHGGRVLLFSSTLPTVGVGLLKSRESTATVTSDRVNPLLLPQGDFYAKLGRQASSFGVSFVLVATPTAHLDLASIGPLATTTSGHIVYYPNFASDRSGEALGQEVCHLLWKPFVYDAVLRVRAGSALQTGEYLGNYTTLNQTDYQFAALDCDQTFAVTLLYDAKLSENEMVSFQCAVLHTTPEGQRRIRVHNLALKVTSAMANIFRMADLDALIQLFCKRAVSQLASAPIPTLVTQFHVRSAQALASYRKFCAQNMPSGQLVLPESLKLLPIYCLAFSKSIAFSPGVQLNDLRMAALCRMMGESLSLLPLRLYPRLFALHRLPEAQHPGVDVTTNGAEATRPAQLRLSQEFIEPHGIYLIDDTERIRILICSMVDPEVLSSLFGVAQAVALNVAGTVALPDLNNALSYHARRLVDQIQAKYDRPMPLLIIRQGIDAADADWQQCLVEDVQASLGPSYTDFLCRLHGQITHEMNSSSLAEKTALLSFFQ